jgi:hypothetical protein
LISPHPLAILILNVKLAKKGRNYVRIVRHVEKTVEKLSKIFGAALVTGARVGDFFVEGLGLYYI